MAINVLQAAKHLCEKSQWKYTNLELQKLLYMCNMVFLGNNNEPLLEGKFEAWDYGPVHSELYHYLKKFGSDNIPQGAFKDIEDLNSDIKIFDIVSDNYPPGSGSKLVGITHQEIGAWYKKYKVGVKGRIISNSDIFEEYERRITRQKERVS